MTAKQAKEETLLVWRYLAEHPEIRHKTDLPKEIWNKIEGYENYCPLCEYTEVDGDGECSDCVLYCCAVDGSSYDRWCYADYEEQRIEAAREIVEKVEKWEVQE
jgi:hypothetical protein